MAVRVQRGIREMEVPLDTLVSRVCRGSREMMVYLEKSVLQDPLEHQSVDILML